MQQICQSIGRWVSLEGHQEAAAAWLLNQLSARELVDTDTTFVNELPDAGSDDAKKFVLATQMLPFASLRKQLVCLSNA